MRPPEGAVGSGTGPTAGEPRRLTIVCRDAGERWVLAQIPQVVGDRSQKRDEARGNVTDAFSDVLAVPLDAPPSVQGATAIELTIAA